MPCQSNPTTVVSSNKFFEFLCDKIPELRNDAGKTLNAIEIGMFLRNLFDGTAR